MSGKWCDFSKSVGSFVEDLGGQLKFNTVEAVGDMPADPAVMAQTFFELEKSMSQKIFAFMKAAEETDVEVHEFLCSVVEKRVKMEKHARQFMQLCELAGTDYLGLDHSVKHQFRG